MWHARAGKDRKLLSPYKGQHAVNYRNSCLNKRCRVFSSFGIHGLTVDIDESVSDWIRQAVIRPPKAIKYSAKQLLRHRHLHCLTKELSFGASDGKPSGAFKYLHD